MRLFGAMKNPAYPVVPNGYLRPMDIQKNMITVYRIPKTENQMLKHTKMQMTMMVVMVVIDYLWLFTIIIILFNTPMEK